MSGRAERLRRALARPSIVAIAAVIGVIVFAQGLTLGFQADDIWHQIFLTKPARFSGAGVSSPLLLFDFYDGDPARTRWLMDQGMAVWWTDPTVRLRFLRPLTAITHLVDHALFPGSAAIAHACSLAWYAALVAAVAALYRRVIGATWVAGLAAIFYAIDYNHGVIATWIANRSALVAGALGVASVIAHIRSRGEASLRWRLISPLLLAASLLAGEPGLGACAWLGAWAITMDEGPRARRIAALAPHAAVAIAWAAIYRAGLWGAHGSRLYVDPTRAPIAYVLGLFEKVPVLVAAELAAPGPDIVMFAGRGPALALLAFAIVIVALAAVALAPFLRVDRASRFFALGALLSILPVCATFASARLLTLPGIGLIGLVAQLVGAAIDRAAPIPTSGAIRRVTLAAALLFGLTRGPFSILGAQAGARQVWFLDRLMHRWSDPIDDRGLASQRLVVVNAPSIPFVGYIIPLRFAGGRAVPKGLLSLGAGTRDLEIERPDAQTLHVRQADGFAKDDLELLTASGERRWRAGDEVALTGVRITVLEATPDARPSKVAFRFEVPLEDEALRWVQWDGTTLLPFQVPWVGGAVKLEGRTLDPI